MFHAVTAEQNFLCWKLIVNIPHTLTALSKPGVSVFCFSELEIFRDCLDGDVLSVSLSISSFGSGCSLGYKNSL